MKNRRYTGSKLRSAHRPARLAHLAFALACLVSSSSRADCFDSAATFHHVNPLILRAIALIESRGNPKAVNKNANGSYDFGMMQINSIHLPELARYGIGKSDLLDGCKSVYTGAWILRQKMDQYGNTWDAVGAYNSATPAYRARYAAKIRGMVIQLVQAGYDAG